MTLMDQTSVNKNSYKTYVFCSTGENVVLIMKRNVEMLKVIEFANGKEVSKFSLVHYRKYQSNSKVSNSNL